MSHTLSIDQLCVGFLYTLVVRRPSGSLEAAVSRKASLLSLSVSMVKQIEGICQLSLFLMVILFLSCRKLPRP